MSARSRAYKRRKSKPAKITHFTAFELHQAEEQARKYLPGADPLAAARRKAKELFPDEPS